MKHPIVMEDLTDPIEIAKARELDAKFELNWVWFEAYAPEIYKTYRGKCLCVAGQQLFVGDTPEDAICLARTAHPDDIGFYTRIIPTEKIKRIYATGTTHSFTLEVESSSGRSVSAR